MIAIDVCSVGARERKLLIERDRDYFPNKLATKERASRANRANSKDRQHQQAHKRVSQLQGHGEASSKRRRNPARTLPSRRQRASALLRLLIHLQFRNERRHKSLQLDNLQRLQHHPLGIRGSQGARNLHHSHKRQSARTDGHRGERELDRKTRHARLQSDCWKDFSHFGEKRKNH